MTSYLLFLVGVLAAVLTGCLPARSIIRAVPPPAPEPTALEWENCGENAPEPGEIRINEVMASNKATLADEEGCFADWLIRNRVFRSAGRLTRNPVFCLFPTSVHVEQNI